MKPIDCQIRSIIRDSHGLHRGQQNVTLEPVLRTPYQFGNFEGELPIVQGHWAWNDDHYFLLLDTDEATGYPLFGTYMFYDGVAYALSRDYYDTAHDAQDYAMSRLGTPMIKWLARIDAMELHPALVEPVPA